MNRREFIAAGAGAFFIASADRIFGAGAPSNRVRLAIVGCRDGGRGHGVLMSLVKVPGVEVATVCDVDRRAREFAADFVFRSTGVRPKMEKDLRKVLEDRLIDGIVSETPDHIHAWSAVMAMKAGKAVYVEKPCCFCPAEGQILLRVAKETGRVLQVGSQRRSSLSLKAALAYLKETKAVGEMRFARAWYQSDRPSIGTGRPCAVPEWLDWDLWQGPAPREGFRDNIVPYNWHWFRKWGTSEMGNNAPHFIDVARWFLGLDTFPEAVQCAGGLCFPKGGDFEWPDVFNSSFRYPGGKIISFDLTCHGRSKMPMDDQSGVLVYGEKGSVYLSPRDTATIFDEKGKVVREWLAGGLPKTETISLSNPTGGLDGLHLANFADCIRANDTRTAVPADVGVKSSVLPLLANIAADCGETVHVNPLTGDPVGKTGADKWAREYEKGWELS